MGSRSEIDSTIPLAAIERVAGILCNLDEDLEPDNPWGHRLIGANRDAPHYGDCTKASCPCVRCLYITETERARKLLAAMGDLASFVKPSA